MRYLIVIEPLDDGYAVQVPDLAVSTFGETLKKAKTAAKDAILANLETYHEIGQRPPLMQIPAVHLENPDFSEMLFMYVDVEIDVHEEEAVLV